MPSCKKALFPPAVIIFFAACPESPEPPRLPAGATPIPETVSISPQAGSEQEISPSVLSKKAEDLIKDAPIKRFSTPGSVRWIRDMDKPITFIRWSPLAGLVVSVGEEVHNVTSRGEDRWHFVGGPNHALYALGSAEVIWSPAFNRLRQLLQRGRQGWSRKWSGKLVADQNGGIYLLDASTIAAIGQDGKDKWRASPEGLRKLDGPFTCRGGMLFNGLSGLMRVAVLISEGGSVSRETALERGAVLVGAGSSCEPLVSIGGEIAMLDARGNSLWRRPATETPFIHRLETGFAIVNASEDGSVGLEVITDQGRVVQSTDLPVSGRITSVGIQPHSDFKIEAIGMCTDVTSPCSRPDGNRGPFNALLTATSTRNFRTLIRHVQGHLNFTQYSDRGLLVASSSGDFETDLVLRDNTQAVTWQVTLPGRLSAGPYVGPSGEVYLGTCRGWECSAPHLLIAVTGQESLPEKED
jgi:hypothetical protein